MSDVEQLPHRTRIGDYLLLDRIGEGGVGVVHRARHFATGAVVALKTAKDDRGGHLASLRREFWTLRQLRRRGVIQLLDGGTFDGRPWFAMELLEGATLAALLTSGDVTHSTFLPGPGPTRSSPAIEPKGPKRRVFDAAPVSTFLTLIRRVAETLSFLHGEGIVHRDIKPSNLFVRPDGTPVLMDFGLVRRYGVGGREVLDVSDAAGTAGYMAPEQAHGQRIDARTDLYALGCILYQGIVGQAPFSAPTHVELLRLHANVPPVPPREMVEKVPPALDELILRMMAKNPRDRIGYATDVAEALASLGADGWEPPEPPAPPTAPYRPQVVGRSGAFEEIDGTVAALRESHGAFFLVDGESGIGKTAFAAEVARTAAQYGINIVTGECGRDTPAGAADPSPLRPLQPLLHTIVDRCVTGGPEVTNRLLGSRGRALALYEPGLASLPATLNVPDPPALPPEAARTAMLGLLSDVVGALAREKPLLLVVDDLQWCDDLSAAFLELLAGDLCARERLVVVATCRSEETTPAIERIRRAQATRAFRLERLDRIALAEMVSDMLAVPQAPPDLTSSLWEVSAGNPFFVTEYLRALIGEKLLVRNRASWHAAGPTVSFGRLPLPHSIHELIQRRLAGLEGASVQVLEVAAVIGRDMDLRLLTSAATAATGDAFKVELGIHILIERQILEESTGNRLRFIHGKIRDEAYRAVAEPRAREIHRDVAALLERWPDRPGDFEAEAAVIGRHYAVAGEISRAIPHLHSAADHAREVHANEGAIALYDETLDLLRHQQKGDTPLAASLLESKADLLALVGRRGEARTSYEAALLQSTHAPATDAARRFRKMGKTWEREHRHAEALQLYARAEQSLGEVPPATAQDQWWRAWLDVQVDRIWSHYWSAQLEAMEQAIAAVSEPVDRWGSPSQRAGFYQSLTLLSARKERFRLSEQTVQHARLAMQAQQLAGDAWQLPLVRFGLGFALLLHDEYAEAEGELQTGLREAERTGDQTLIARFLSYLALLHRKTAATDTACGLAQRIIGIPSSGQMSDYHGVAHATLGWAAWRVGSPDAQKHLALAVDLWKRPPAVFPFQWQANAPLLAIATDSGDLAAAAACVRELLGPTQQRLPASVEELAREVVEAPDKHQSTRSFRELLVILRRESFL